MAFSSVVPQLAVKSYILIGVVVFLVLRVLSGGPKSSKAPGIRYGSIPLIKRWRGAYNFLKDPKGVIDEGSTKYKDSYFRFSTHTNEYTVVTDKKKIAEFLAAPEDVLSFKDAVNEMLQTEWTLGYGVAHRQYHVALVRSKFTQTIAASTPGMFAELQSSVGDLIGSPRDWVEVPLYNVVTKMVARVSNNAFADTLFCRNDQYLQHAIDYAQSVVLTAELLRLFPVWMKPLIARMTPFRRLQRQAREAIGPIVQERLDTDWDTEKQRNKPDDMIQILIDGAPPIERTMPQIVERLMTLNMASIHTTSMTVTAAIYALAAEADKYVPALRAEAEQNSVDGKIDKMALSKLVKLDSFIREVGRVEPLGLVALVRHASKEFTFADGMVIPRGSYVCAPIEALHVEVPGTDHNTFDGFRYSSFNEANTGATKYQMVNTDLNYLLFGHGKHACPGRFLAVTEMKLMLATLILDYDIKLIPGTKPKNFFFGTARVPEMKLPILIKARTRESKA